MGQRKGGMCGVRAVRQCWWGAEVARDAVCVHAVDGAQEVSVVLKDGLDSVVLAPVEASVNRLLDAAAGRLEQRGHGQGGAGNRPARRLGGDPRRTAAQGPARRRHRSCRAGR
jgi:hypothetical protein